MLKKLSLPITSSKLSTPFVFVLVFKEGREIGKRQKWEGLGTSLFGGYRKRIKMIGDSQVQMTGLYH